MTQLKKAFQVINNNKINRLIKYNTEVIVSNMMIESAKSDLVKALNSRSKLLKSMLLKDFNYILSPQDIVIFIEQTSEIRVYNSNGTIQNQPYEEEV